MPAAPKPDDPVNKTRRGFRGHRHRSQGHMPSACRSMNGFGELLIEHVDRVARAVPEEVVDSPTFTMCLGGRI